MKSGSRIEYLDCATLFNGLVQMSTTRSEIPALAHDEEETLYALEIFMRGSPDVIYRRLVQYETDVNEILEFASDLSKAAQKLKKEISSGQSQPV